MSERFVGRNDELTRLNEWLRDSSITFITVTGLGGIGKTSLVKHWINRDDVASARHVAGIFLWSFYAESNISILLDEIVAFGKCYYPKVNPHSESETPLSYVRSLLNQVPLLIALDGVEVLQERPASPSYGAIIDDDLRSLLLTACQCRNGGLVVSTSRFPFTDLDIFSGTSLRNLRLGGLSTADGAEILAVSGFSASEPNFQRVISYLEGHPLSIRIFSSIAQKDPARITENFCNLASPGNKESISLQRKLQNLLDSYRNLMSSASCRLLGLIALFRAPVSQSTLTKLYTQLATCAAAPEFPKAPNLDFELQELSKHHLISADRDQGGEKLYSCHAVLKEYFRHLLLSSDAHIAQVIARNLTDRPDWSERGGLQEVTAVATAIEILIEAGDFRSAHDLYVHRLNGGESFITLPAVGLGLDCTSQFVTGQTRVKALGEQLGVRTVGSYLSMTGFFAMTSGDLRLAQDHLSSAISTIRNYGAFRALPSVLHNYAECLTYLARFAPAIDAADRAIRIGGQESAPARVCRAYCLALCGRMEEALSEFEDLVRLSGWLVGYAGIRWADLLCRLHEWTYAEKVIEYNFRYCSRERRNQDAALCHWLFGRVDLAAGRTKEASKNLLISEQVLRDGHMVNEQPLVLLAQADVAGTDGDLDKAEAAIAEALTTSAARGRMTIQIDALWRRAEITLKRASFGSSTPSPVRNLIRKSFDDYELALELARRSDYAWGEWEAIRVGVGIARLNNNKELEERLRREHAALGKKLHIRDLSSP